MKTADTNLVARLERVARIAAAAALVALAWALVVALSGGIRLHAGSLILSSRDPLRSGLAALVLYAVSLLCGRPGRRSAAWIHLRADLERRAPLAVVMASAGVLWFALAYGARVASGADTFGYVSEAYLWLKGDLRIPEPLASGLPWPFALDSLSPLGYRPGAGATIVPTYSPGLPLIMAAFQALFGHCGPYYVQPVFGALFVAIAFGLACRVSGDRLTGTLAAVFLASSPAFLFNLMTPMSDTVTAALWTSALLLLTWPGVIAAGGAGCLAAVAILVRPNLFPLVAAGALATALWPAGHSSPRPRIGRLLIFLTAIVPAALFIALLNQHLYGSVRMSGYGPLSSLYALGLFPGNASRYSSWLLQSQGPFVFLAMLPLLVRRMRPAWLTWSLAAPAAVFVLLLCASYLFYAHFRDWWYLRFFLPAFPLLFIMMSAPLAWFVRTAPAPVSLPALILIVAFALKHSIGFVVDYGTLGVGRAEDRYVAVAEYIERELPPNAVIVSMQHSGTIRFYSGRPTLRYDAIPPDHFDAVLTWLTAKNYKPYILLENWEEADYRRQFAGLGSLGSLDVLIVAELRRPGGIRLYDPSQRSNASPPQPIDMPLDSRCLHPRAAWAR